MNNEIFLLVVNSFLYIAVAVYYIKIFGFSFKTYPLILWAISSLACIYYFTSPERYHTFVDKLTLLPFLYLFILIFISFIPLLRFQNEKIMYIAVNQDLYVIICAIIIIISLVPLFPNIVYFLRNITVEDAFLEQYETKMQGEKLRILSGLAAHMMRYCKYLRGVVPILFVLSFTKYVKKNNYIRIGLAVAWLNCVVNFMNSSSRYAIITDLLYLVFIFLFFQKSFNLNTNKLAKVIFVFIVGIFALIVTSMTIQRFGAGSRYTKTITYNLSLYAGESFVNFNGDMWNMMSTAKGENCLWQFKKLFEGRTDGDNRNYPHLERIVHRRMNVFYTFIGDYYTDAGRNLTVAIVVFLSFLFTILTKVRPIMSLGTFILLALYAKVLIVGFTYWTYLNYTLEIVGSLVVAALFLNVKPTNLRDTRIILSTGEKSK